MKMNLKMMSAVFLATTLGGIKANAQQPQFLAALNPDHVKQINLPAAPKEDEAPQASFISGLDYGQLPQAKLIDTIPKGSAKQNALISSSYTNHPNFSGAYRYSQTGSQMKMAQLEYRAGNLNYFFNVADTHNNNHFDTDDKSVSIEIVEDGKEFSTTIYMDKSGTKMAVTTAEAKQEFHKKKRLNANGSDLKPVMLTKDQLVEQKAQIFKDTGIDLTVLPAYKDLFKNEWIVVNKGNSAVVAAINAPKVR